MHAWSVMLCCLCDCVFVFVCHSEEVPGLYVLCVCVCACLLLHACVRKCTLDIYVYVSACAPSHLPQVDSEEMVDL